MKTRVVVLDEDEVDVTRKRRWWYILIRLMVFEEIANGIWRREWRCKKKKSWWYLKVRLINLLKSVPMLFHCTFSLWVIKMYLFGAWLESVQKRDNFFHDLTEDCILQQLQTAELFFFVCYTISIVKKRLSSVRLWRTLRTLLWNIYYRSFGLTPSKLLHVWEEILIRPFSWIGSWRSKMNRNGLGFPFDQNNPFFSTLL